MFILCIYSHLWLCTLSCVMMSFPVGEYSSVLPWEAMCLVVKNPGTEFK